MASQLVALPEVERLSPTVIRILGGNPGKFTLQGTNTYLVGTGRHRLLVDTGEGRAAWIAALRRVLRDEDATVADVVLTHEHHDHIGGVTDVLRDVNPDARVYKHRPGPGQLDIPDGHRFGGGDGGVPSLTAVHTPGHTKDHMVLVFPDEDAMFTGDNVLGQGTSVYEDLKAYMDSLHRMRPLFRGRAYPGHGPVITDGPARIAEYISHRQQREDQVVAMLRAAEKDGSAAEGMTIMDLVGVIYSDVREDLHLAAARGVMQILTKLRQEQKVDAEGEKWRLRRKQPL